MAASKSSYKMKFNSVLWTVTSGSQYALGWWYGKQAVFYLPPEWFGPAQWWLALPFAPLGKFNFVKVLNGYHVVGGSETHFTRFGERRSLANGLQTGPKDRRGYSQRFHKYVISHAHMHSGPLTSCSFLVTCAECCTGWWQMAKNEGERERSIIRILLQCNFIKAPLIPSACHV
jgi:hypothetical protein